MVLPMILRSRLATIVAVVLLAAVTSAPPALAQGWFGNLFGGGFAPRPRQGAPAYPGYDGGYPSGGYGGSYGSRMPDGAAPPRRRAHRHKPAATDQAEKGSDKGSTDRDQDKPAAPKTAAVTFVHVFGDSLGQMLANGLDEAMADRADVGIVHDAKGSSGLVVTDFYDWPKVIAGMLDAKPASGKAAAGEGDDAKPSPRIDVGVMMIGTNDRQPIRENGQTLQQGSPEWLAAYTRRVLAIDEAFRAHRVPLIWVGVPITKADGFADSMAAFNDIYREAAAKTGAIYVDTWDAFSDDEGDFVFNGPDVNGRIVRLRSSDGIHFTKAGARKLAHFVETHVRRALDGKTPVPQLPTAELPATGGKPAETAKPDAGQIRNLAEAPKAANGELATLDAAKRAAAERAPLVATTMVRGEAMPIPAGRADDARWPKGGTLEP